MVVLDKAVFTFVVYWLYRVAHSSLYNEFLFLNFECQGTFAPLCVTYGLVASSGMSGRLRFASW